MSGEDSATAAVRAGKIVTEDAVFQNERGVCEVEGATVTAVFEILNCESLQR